MKWLGLKTSCIVIMLLTLSACNRGQEAKFPTKGLTQETITAYQKLGGVYGEWGKGADPLKKDIAPSGNVLPGFILRTFPKTKLPEVPVPFVLDLSHSNVTDAELKELASHKNLVMLYLYHTKVTDAGVAAFRQALPDCQVHR